VRTFLNATSRSLGLVSLLQPVSFLELLAHYHGQVWNAAETARTPNLSEGYHRRYVDLLQDLSWCACCSLYANLVNAGENTKVYIRDTGLRPCSIGHPHGAGTAVAPHAAAHRGKICNRRGD